MVMPSPGPSIGGIEPRSPRRPPGMISSKIASSGSKNSGMRKFGIDTRAWIEATVQIGPFGLCGATGM